MSIRTWLFLGAALCLLTPGLVRADDLFRLYWRVTYYTTNSTSHIVAASLSEQDLVNQVAQNNNLDASQLVLVYRPNERDAAVVRTDGTFIASVFQMGTTYTDVVNPTGSVIVRHALLGDSAHSTPLGSFFGLELRTVSSNGALLNDSFLGTVLYAIPETDQVFGGQISTGARVVDTTAGG